MTKELEEIRERLAELARGKDYNSTGACVADGFRQGFDTALTDEVLLKHPKVAELVRACSKMKFNPEDATPFLLDQLFYLQSALAAFQTEGEK